jgi:hypothetical protein
MMKIGKPIPVILIIILTMLSLHTNLYQINAQIMGSSGKRIIEIHANYAIVRDEIYIPEVTVNLTQHIPKQYSNELFMVKAYDEKGVRDLALENEEDGVKIVVLGGVKGKITIETYLINHLKKSADKYVFQYPIYPILDVTIEAFNTTIIYPAETLNVTTIIPPTNITTMDGWKAKYAQSPLPMQTTIELYTSFKASITPIVIDKIIRYVNIGQEIGVKDEITVRNPTDTTISRGAGFKFHMPPGTSISSATDPLGPVNYKVNSTSTATIVTIYPRIDLQSGWTYGFTLEYKLPRERYVAGGQQETLTIPIDTIIQTPIKQMNVTVKFSEGTKILSYTGTPTKIEGTILKYDLSGFIAKDYGASDLKATYIPGQTPMQIPINILAYTIIALTATSTIYLKYRFSKVKMATKVSYIRAIYDAYLKEKDLYIKLKETIEKYGDEEISRKQYLEEKKRIMDEIKALTDKINEAKMKVESEEARSKIGEIEEEMGKLKALMDRIEDIEGRRISKTIRRVEYQRIRDANEKAYARIMRRIDARINELREIKL